MNGFYARIKFQNPDKPWQYAFIQQIRNINPSVDEIDFFDCFTGTDDNSRINNWAGTNITFDNFPGQTSMWNIGDEAWGSPDSELGTHQVALWAVEINYNESVPMDTIVWIETGELYNDKNGMPCCDYTFAYDISIWAMIKGGHAISYTGGNDNQYQWSEEYRSRALTTNQKVKWSDAVNKRHSIPNSYAGTNNNILYPAREINGNTGVPTGVYVRLIPGAVIEYNTDGTIYNQEWLFSWTAQSGGASGFLGMNYTGVQTGVSFTGVTGLFNTIELFSGLTGTVCGPNKDIFGIGLSFLPATWTVKTSPSTCQTGFTPVGSSGKLGELQTGPGLSFVNSGNNSVGLGLYMGVNTGIVHTALNFNTGVGFIVNQTSDCVVTVDLSGGGTPTYITIPYLKTATTTGHLKFNGAGLLTSWD